jgi:hypothetical protein
VTQYEINLATPAFMRLKDGSRIQNGCLADYPGYPMPRGRFMMFDMLRRRMSIHDAVKSLAAAAEHFPKEWKRQTRVALRLHYGLPADPVDAFPIN